MTETSDQKLCGLLQALRLSLDGLKSGPKQLEKQLQWHAEQNDLQIARPAIRSLMDHLRNAGPNSQLKTALALKLHEWDREHGVAWTSSTLAHSKERRQHIYHLLEVPTAERQTIDDIIPRFMPSELPIVVADEHEDWLLAKKKNIRWRYWKDYRGQLLSNSGAWSDEAISVLDESTDDVLARLSDPSAHQVYQVKGLVVGYVQSGKTAHFSGLIAKAADCGYKLIIVLAGTMNILREQTQRRIDKELVGRELLSEQEYGQDAEWKLFVSHGCIPSHEEGGVDFERLTDQTEDYAALKSRIGALDFRRVDLAKPFNDPVNLLPAPVRLIVIKKIPKRLNALSGDLSRLKKERRAPLEQVPTLVIDDESDQASVNIVNPERSEDNARPETNRAIVELLKTLPRAQYVGYTATPFANVFINPDDAEDLFPKDFIVSLPRPPGYMGASDLYDLERKYEPGDLHSNEQAFVRDVRDDDDRPENLRKALDSFVLAGAIKLYRELKDPGAFRFRHHTMLIHHGPRKKAHEEQANRVKDAFTSGDYPRTGLARLRDLLNADFRPVARTQNPEAPFPNDFDELKPHIAACIARLQQDKTVRIVNGDNRDDTPDFDCSSVWAILVGGTKLSRGYTVEGLTTTYYRRVATAADTLMQMGRWFGFRPGYRDLVRVFIGRDEPIGSAGRKRMDLHEAFGAICRDEEAFRQQLIKYARDTGIRPIQIPPLVMSHLERS